MQEKSFYWKCCTSPVIFKKKSKYSCQECPVHSQIPKDPVVMHGKNCSHHPHPHLEWEISSSHAHFVLASHQYLLISPRDKETCLPATPVKHDVILCEWCIKINNCVFLCPRVSSPENKLPISLYSFTLAPWRSSSLTSEGGCRKGGNPISSLQYFAKNVDNNFYY